MSDRYPTPFEPIVVIGWRDGAPTHVERVPQGTSPTIMAQNLAASGEFDDVECAKVYWRQVIQKT